MKKCEVCIIGGSCGTFLIAVTDHLKEVFTAKGLDCKVYYQNALQNSEPPETADVVLQSMPLLTEKDVRCPLISIRPLIVDLNQVETMQKILTTVEQICASN
jgi:hypothetical protein